MKPFSNSSDAEPSQVNDVVTAELQSLYRYACYRLGNREAARDAIQELYLALHQRDTRHIRNLRCYIYRALANRCTQYLREQQRRHFVDVATVGDLRADDLAPADYEQEQALIGRLLGLIPDEQSEVIRLHLHGNLSFADIAEVLEIPLPTAKSRYRYGIEHLRRELQRQGLI